MPAVFFVTVATPFYENLGRVYRLGMCLLIDLISNSKRNYYKTYEIYIQRF